MNNKHTAPPQGGRRAPRNAGVTNARIAPGLAGGGTLIAAAMPGILPHRIARFPATQIKKQAAPPAEPRAMCGGKWPFMRLAVGLILVIACIVPLCGTLRGASQAKKQIHALPWQTALPNPFILNNGQRVKTAADWELRRLELIKLFLQDEYGTLPTMPQHVAAKVLSSRRSPGMGRAEKIHLAMGKGQKVTLNLDLHVPATAGKHPAIIYLGRLHIHGWLKKYITIPTHEILSRGYVLAGVNNADIVDDMKHKSEIFTLYPGYTWGTLSAEAWEIHGIVKYLQSRPDVNANQIILVGFSRWGKEALLAGALNRHIAMVGTVCPGCAGAGCFRFKPGNQETIRSTTRAFPAWYAKRFALFDNLYYAHAPKLFKWKAPTPLSVTHQEN